MYWLALPQVYRYHTRRATGGRRDDSWVNYCALDLLAGSTPLDRILSVGCGTGALERHLAQLGAFRHCDAWDISPGAIETARRLAREEGLETISYQVVDANSAELPAEHYDAVWFNSSLHHVEALERMCEQVAAGLKPRGWLFLNEYVGPSVFNLPPRQKQAIRAAFELIPPRYRRQPGRDGWAVAPGPAIPNPAAVAAADPSESVRSAEILDIVGHYFEVAVCHGAGGTLLQFLLHGIAGNFRPEDPGSLRLLDLLLRIEEMLLDAGDLQDDFVVLAARRRDRPAPPLPRPAAGAAPPAAAELPPGAAEAPAASTEETQLRAEVAHLRETLRRVESTRIWRLAHLYWNARRRLGSWLRRDAV